MGTRALWQHTQATSGHRHSGRGSARRVREFRIGADVFSQLARGEAVIYTPVAGHAGRARIQAVYLPDEEPDRIKAAGERHPCEIAVHPGDQLANREYDAGSAQGRDTGGNPRPPVPERADPMRY
jgi:hypothetical protein